MRKIFAVVLVIMTIGCFVLCAPKTVDQKALKTYVTVKAPGATIHKGEDVKAKNDFIGVLAPGISAEVIGQKIIAYQILTEKGVKGWIYAPLAEKLTNR